MFWFGQRTRLSVLPIAGLLAVVACFVVIGLILANALGRKSVREQFTIGPERGYLMIAGGGKIGTGILRSFVALSGGQNARIVFVPTAEDDGIIDRYFSTNSRLGTQHDGHYAMLYDECTPQTFYALGVHNVTVLHTRNRDTANSVQFVEPLDTATGVWFSGGRQWRLADSYLNTRTQKALFALLNRGGTIGGTSAGASIQGSFLVRGDSTGNALVEGNHKAGFGFLSNAAIDQHILPRHREFDLVPLIQKRNELLGIGIDEGTAVVVHGDQPHVLGSSIVAITDAKRLNTGRMLFGSTKGPGCGVFYLHSGQVFNLTTRTVEVTHGITPVDVKVWPK